MSNYTTVSEYLTHFCDGDVEGIAATLAANFRLRGPLFAFDTRDAYIASLRDDPPDVATYRVLAMSEGDDNVSVFYNYEKQSGSFVVAQYFRIRNGKITDTLLVFDRGESV